MQTYPMIKALVRYGSMSAALTAIAVMALGIYLASSSGVIVYALAGFVAAAVVYALLKSYSELVAIIADMMLPK